MKQRILTSVIALSLLASIPAWGQTTVIKRQTASQTVKARTKANWDIGLNFKEGLAKVSKYLNNGFYSGFVNKTGELVVPCKWHGADDFSEGLAAVMDENRNYGYIDKTGKVVIPCKWESAKPFSEGLAQVKEDGKYGYVDKTGTVIIPCKWEKAESFSEGLAWVMDKGNYKYILINKQGKIVK